MRPKDFGAEITRYQNISSNANCSFNFALASGLYLIPIDLALRTGPMLEYNYALTQAPPIPFGLVADINGIKKKDVGPVTPNPGDKKPDTGYKKLDIGDKKTDSGTRASIAQEGGKLLTEHRSKLNAVLNGASVLVLFGFALQYVVLSQADEKYFLLLIKRLRCLVNIKTSQRQVYTQ